VDQIYSFRYFLYPVAVPGDGSHDLVAVISDSGDAETDAVSTELCDCADSADSTDHDCRKPVLFRRI